MIPSFVLKRLYSQGSLETIAGGVRFSLKNRLSDALLTGLRRIQINGSEVPIQAVELEFADGRRLPADQVSKDNPVRFPLREIVRVHALGDIGSGKSHRIHLAFETSPFGQVAFTVEDAARADVGAVRKSEGIPGDRANDWAPEIVAGRRRWLEERTGVRLQHLDKSSWDPTLAKGNCENLVGVAQVPVGLAGPLRIHGEHARGEYLIPMATTEGTLVASYNRGMKVLNLAGGVTCTISDDRMQRAPVFVFRSAREARDFRDWLVRNMASIREAAESTSSVARLLDIDTYLSNAFAFLRFSFSTGDAAGQNMVTKATLAACSWILSHVDSVVSFYLESNFATDKKGSHVNVLRTRGKRVTAEATIPRTVVQDHLHTEPETLHHQAQIATIGAYLSGASNNGAHSANGIAAMFIACGQDVANVAESSAGIVHSDLTPGGDLHLSLTIPALIVATWGGGTGLPTQRECLEILGCHGKGKARRFAEIVAGVALAGELSLGSAIASLDWVTSHESLGRNR